jgi:hypothetical protein
MSGQRFIRLTHELMDSEAWDTASSECKDLVLRIWKRFNGRNNGRISYSRREAEAALPCGPTQAVRYFKEAQELGFIVATKRGSLDGDGAGKATRWRITMEPCGEESATRDFLRWRAI